MYNIKKRKSDSLASQDFFRMEDLLEENNSGSRRWSFEEEVILQGIVIDCHLYHGSEARWPVMNSAFNKAIERFNAMHGTNFSATRSVSAMKKRYRVMFGEDRMFATKWYEIYHELWFTPKFNDGYRLFGTQDL